jgi:hypothetical protein
VLSKCQLIRIPDIAAAAGFSAGYSGVAGSGSEVFHRPAGGTGAGLLETIAARLNPKAGMARNQGAMKTPGTCNPIPGMVSFPKPITVWDRG